MTALWIVWEVARLLGIPVMVGYFVGRWAQRRDTARKQHDAELDARTAELERDKQ